MSYKVRELIAKIKQWISGLSFRTGIALLCICGLCYIMSFAQMLLPIPASVKGILWIILFGAAKATQYSALLILGKTGAARIKSFFRKPASKK